MIKHIRHSFTLLFFATGLSAQDMHFSQFNEQNSLVNPALTGVDNATKATLSYKNQWKAVSAPYTTYGFAFESRLKPGNWQQVDKFRSMTFKEKGAGRLAAGLSVYKDKAGDGNLDLTQGNLSLATFVPVSKKSLMAFGVQGSFSQRRINASSLIFPNQYNGRGYDPGVASNESFQSQSFSYGEIAAGLAYSYKNKLPLASHEKTKVNLGFAAYHLNTAKQKFLALSTDRLYTKYVLYGDFTFTTRNPRIVLAPRFLMQFQGSSFEGVVGLSLKKYMLAGGSKYTGIDKSSALAYGIYYRNNDAVITTFLFEWKEQFGVGLSYDINVSRLIATTSGRGGMEIMLRYTPPGAFLYQMKDKPNTGNGKE